MGNENVVNLALYITVLPLLRVLTECLMFAVPLSSCVITLFLNIFLKANHKFPSDSVKSVTERRELGQVPSGSYEDAEL